MHLALMDTSGGPPIKMTAVIRASGAALDAWK
jgi:hypothetical protein